MTYMGGGTVTVFARAAMSGGWTRQREVIDRLEELQSRGRIDAYETHVWEGRVQIPIDEGSDADPPPVEWYRRFEAWAERNGASLGPAFDHNRRVSEVTGDAYEEFVFPVICLAVHQEGRIVHVAPCKHGEAHLTIDDCLTALDENPETLPGGADDPTQKAQSGDGDSPEEEDDAEARAGVSVESGD